MYSFASKDKNRKFGLFIKRDPNKLGNFAYDPTFHISEILEFLFIMFVFNWLFGSWIFFSEENVCPFAQQKQLSDNS